MDDGLTPDLLAMILAQNDANPRSLQTEAGPSDLGHPCERRLALLAAGAPKVNPGGDPWKAIVGTAIHAWLKDAATAANARLGRARWLAEHRVVIAPGLAGTCDLVDTDTGTVEDWKSAAPYKLAQVDRNGMDPEHRAQVNLYAWGLNRAGIPVRAVAVTYLPRNGTLADARRFQEPYDPAVAERHIARLDKARQAPDPAAVPATPTGCDWCPFYTPHPADGQQCAGAFLLRTAA